MWLFGGSVRDLGAGLEPADWDLATAEAAAAAARLAAWFGGTVHRLHDRFSQYRVNLPGPRPRHCDVQDPGVSLDTFLRNRDFTVNAMAVSLRGRWDWRDPCGGARDLAARRLVLLPGALRADPVRALRGLRLSVTRGLTLGAADRKRFRALGPAVRRCAAERLRGEVLAMLACWPQRRRSALLALGLALGQDGRRAGRLNQMEAILPADWSADRRLRLRWLAAMGASRPRGAALCLTREERALRLAAARLTRSRPASTEAWLYRLAGLRFPSDAARLAAVSGAPGLRSLARRTLAEADRLAETRPWIQGLEAARLSGRSGPELGRLLRRQRVLRALGRLRSRNAARTWCQHARRLTPQSTKGKVKA